MIYDVTREMLEEILKEYIKLAKKQKGELVVFNEKDEYDYIIEKIEDFKNVKTSKGDLVDATIYVNDDDVLYSEFIIGIGKSYDELKKTVLKNSTKEFKQEEEKKIVSNDHFSKFMKGKKR